MLHFFLHTDVQTQPLSRLTSQDCFQAHVEQQHVQPNFVCSLYFFVLQFKGTLIWGSWFKDVLYLVQTLKLSYKARCSFHPC